MFSTSPCKEPLLERICFGALISALDFKGGLAPVLGNAIMVIASALIGLPFSKGRFINWDDICELRRRQLRESNVGIDPKAPAADCQNHFGWRIV